jgi:hypothetical protein
MISKTLWVVTAIAVLAGLYLIANDRPLKCVQYLEGKCIKLVIAK